MSNKCTFIFPNSTPISRIKNELQYEQSTRKLYDDLRTCPSTSQFTPQFGYKHFVELPQSNFPDYTNSLNFS